MRASPSRYVPSVGVPLFLGEVFSVSHLDVHSYTVFPVLLTYHERSVRFVILVLEWGQDYDP